MTTPFNCPGLRDVAARTESVHLISSMDRKGGARTRPKQHHPVPQGPPFSIKCRLATGSPQSIPIKPHSFLKAKTHKHFKAVLPHRPHKCSPHFQCGRGNNTLSQPHQLQTFVGFHPAVQSPRSHRPTVPH